MGFLEKGDSQKSEEWVGTGGWRETFLGKGNSMSKGKREETGEGQHGRGER